MQSTGCLTAAARCLMAAAWLQMECALEIRFQKNALSLGWSARADHNSPKVGWFSSFSDGIFGVFSAGGKGRGLHQSVEQCTGYRMVAV